LAEVSSPLELLVGLGNPGPQYVLTRHNAGFWWIDELASRYGGHFRAEAKFGGEVCRISTGARSLWLLKPMTFMNRSGQSIVRFASFYKIPLRGMLIAHDELDLPPGTVRLKRGGGHGGHNGLRDAIRHLGGNDFLRLRLGIGHPGNSGDVVDYVLHRASLGEQELIEGAIEDAAREFPRLVEGQLEHVMHALHSRRASTDA
jgi:PTH1 family peptidyl-tRNA hydrolase